MPAVVRVAATVVAATDAGSESPPLHPHATSASFRHPTRPDGAE